jgi:hypothetical protein
MSMRAIIDLVSRNELVDIDGPRALDLYSLKLFVLNDGARMMCFRSNVL